MTHRFRTVAFLLILGAVSVSVAAQQKGDGKTPGSEFVGTWSGSWQMDASSGGFELTLEKGKDGALGGRVSVTGEPTYQAVLKTVKFDGNKMAATYDFTPDDRLEVVLATTFEGNTAKGTWTARGKDGSGDVASGSLSFTRK